MPLYDFIGAGLAQHLVTAIRFQDQRRRLTRDRLSVDFDRGTPVRPGKITLGANRESGEKQTRSEWQKHPKGDPHRAEVEPHFHPLGPLASGP